MPPQESCQELPCGHRKFLGSPQIREQSLALRKELGETPTLRSRSCNSGSIAFNEGRFKDAEDLLRDAVQGISKSAFNRQPSLGNAPLARTLLAQGKTVNAPGLLRKPFKWPKSSQRDHRNLMPHLHWLPFTQARQSSRMQLNCRRVLSQAARIRIRGLSD